jgi:hypothetical protein
MRFVTRTVLVSFLVLSVAPELLAQHGYGTGHIGSPVARGIGPGGGHTLPVPRVGTPPLGLVPPAASYTGIRPGALSSHGPYGIGRNYSRNYRRLPYGYFFAPYYYPFLDYASSPYLDYGYGGYGYDAAGDPNAQGALMAQNMLGDQINRLSAEIDQMRYAQQQMAPPPPAPSEDPQPPSRPVTLVLRNGQQLRVHNYAVMDETFWDFSVQPARQIPIANIDVAASAKATIANGGEFPELETNSHNVQ